MKAFLGRRWVQLTGVGLLALLLGVGIGNAESTTTPTPAAAPTVELNEDIAAIEAREDAVAERELVVTSTHEELVALATELAELEADLAAREEAVTATEEAVAASSIGEGTWTVGVDIEPGTYRAADVSADCYWAITASGTNGADILENDIPGGGNPSVTLSEGQDFNTNRCGTWTRS